MPRATALLPSLAAVALVACASPPEGTPSEPLGTASAADSTTCPKGTLLEGIDISSGQGAVSWVAARDAGIAWTIMKGTQGDYDLDKSPGENWAPAKDAGVVRGMYHFFDPTLDGVAQANYFLNAMGPLDAEDLSPMLDVECPASGDSTCLGFAGGTGDAPAAEIRQRMLDWLATVEAVTGRKPILYSFASYFAANAIDTTGFDAYPFWTANPRTDGCFTTPSPWATSAIWQYSFTGTVSGVTGQVDRDRMVASIDELLGWPAPKRASHADVNGDGRADVCGRGAGGVLCALGTGTGTFGAPIAGPAWSDLDGWRAATYASTVQLGDIDGDGKSDVCARAIAGVACALSIGSGFPTDVAGPSWSDAAGWAVPSRYATMQLADIDGDGKADVCGRDGDGITCARSLGSSFDAPFRGPAWSDAAGWTTPSRYRTIRFPDLDGDGKADVCGRDADGVHCALSTGTGFGAPFAGPGWSDATGWKPAAYASTIQFPDVDGDGRADVCGRGAAGITCALSTGSSFGALFAGPAWSDAAGYAVPGRYAAIVFLDLDGDGRADVCGRSSDGMRCALSTGTGFAADFAGPAWSDAAGWGEPRYFGTIGAGDVDGDGRDDLCARGATGMQCALSAGAGFGAIFPVGGAVDAGAGDAAAFTWGDPDWGVAPYWATVTLAGRAAHARSGGGDGGAATAPDAGSTTDAGGRPSEDGGTDDGGDGVSAAVSASVAGRAGCGCRATERAESGVGALPAAVVAAAFARRRRRRTRLVARG